MSLKNIKEKIFKKKKLKTKPWKITKNLPYVSRLQKKKLFKNITVDSNSSNTSLSRFLKIREKGVACCL